jgi:hypothetical protein
METTADSYYIIPLRLNMYSTPLAQDANFTNVFEASYNSNSKTLFGGKSIACINSKNLWSKSHYRLSYGCVYTTLSFDGIHYRLSLLSLPFSSSLLKNSVHNLRYSAATLIPLWQEFYCSDKFLEVKKLHFYTNLKLYICTRIISRSDLFLTFVCVLEVFQLGVLDVILYIR